MEEQKEDVLDELRREYPVGTKYIGAAGNKEEYIVLEGKFKIIEEYPLTVYGDTGQGCIVYEGKKAKIISKPLAYHDKVIFDGPNGPLEYTISANHLIYYDGSNNQIFTDLGMSYDETYILCDEAYGYRSGRSGSWPTFEPSDYAAAGRIVEKLHKLCHEAKSRSPKFKVGDIVMLKHTIHGIPAHENCIIRTATSNGYELRGTGMYKSAVWAGIVSEDILELVGEHIVQPTPKYNIGDHVKVCASGQCNGSGYYSNIRNDYEAINGIGYIDGNIKKLQYQEIKNEWYYSLEAIDTGWVAEHALSLYETPKTLETPRPSNGDLLERFPVGSLVRPLYGNGKLYPHSDFDFIVKADWKIHGAKNKIWFINSEGNSTHQGYIYDDGKYAEVITKSVDSTPKVDTKAILMIELQEKYKPGVKFQPVNKNGRLITAVAPIEVKSHWTIEINGGVAWFKDGDRQGIHDGFIYAYDKFAQIYEETTPKSKLRFKNGDRVAIHPDSQYLEQGMRDGDYLHGVVTSTNEDHYLYCYVVQWSNGQSYNYREEDLCPWTEHVLYRYTSGTDPFVIDSTPTLIDGSPARLVTKTEGTAVKKLSFTRI